MATRGKIYYVDNDFTDAEVAANFGFPSIFILRDNSTGKLTKITVYDATGAKSVAEYKSTGSIQNHPTFANLPRPGDIATIYKTLDTDELYVWDAETQDYILSSIDEAWKLATEQAIAATAEALATETTHREEADLLKADLDASNIDPHLETWRHKINPQPDSYQIGLITTTANSVTIALHPSGENYVIENGVKAVKNVAEAPKSFPPVTGENIRVLIVYGKATTTLLYLAIGAEGLEAVDPDYDGVLIKKIIVKSTGEVVVPVAQGFVPLQGTEAGKPVTGDIEIFTASEEAVGLKAKVEGSETYSYVGFDYEGVPRIEHNSTDNRQVATAFNENGLYVFANNIPNFKGISGSDYWGANYTDNSFVQKKYVDDAIAASGGPSGAYIPKGSVANFAALPTTGNLEGHVYNLLDTGDNYVWVLNLNNTGNAGWDKLSGTVDLTNYWTKTESDNKYQLKGTYLTDAPNDGKQYARKSLGWAEVASNPTLKTINGQSLLGAGNIEVATDINQTKITTSTNITTSTLGEGNLSQNGRNIIIDNGVNDITITCDASVSANFMASYTVVGVGKVTIAGSGILLVDVYGLNKISQGNPGRSFTLERFGTTIYLKINNA